MSAIFVEDLCSSSEDSVVELTLAEVPGYKGVTEGFIHRGPHPSPTSPTLPRKKSPTPPQVPINLDSDSDKEEPQVQEVQDLTGDDDVRDQCESDDDKRDVPCSSPTSPSHPTQHPEYCECRACADPPINDDELRDKLNEESNNSSSNSEDDKPLAQTLAEPPTKTPTSPLNEDFAMVDSTETDDALFIPPRPQTPEPMQTVTPTVQTPESSPLKRRNRKRLTEVEDLLANQESFMKPSKRLRDQSWFQKQEETTALA